MKKLFFLFLTMYTLSFSIPNFEQVIWNTSYFSLSLEYPELIPVSSIIKDEAVYTLYNPEKYVGKYNFYFKKDRLYKIEIVYDNELVGRAEIKEIYDGLVEDMGEPIESREIDEELITTHLRGNSKTFRPDFDTIANFKGIDTFDSDGNLIDTKLMLELINSI